jgi:small subunit ribosomal protein S1
VPDGDVWKRLDAAFRAGDPISGTVVGVGGGFFEVDVGGVIAGMTLAHAGWRAPSDPSSLIGQTLELEIIALTPASGTVVVSRRTRLEERRERTLKSLAVGAIVEATVRSVDAIGAWVDLDEVSALLHRTELSDGPPLPEPGEVLKEGDRIRVRVLELGATISVSLMGVP